MSFTLTKEAVSSYYERVHNARLAAHWNARHVAFVAHEEVQKWTVIRDELVASLIRKPLASTARAHERVSAAWCRAQKAYAAAYAEVLRTQKESKKEFNLRWLKNKEVADKRDEKKQFRAAKRAERIPLRNRFWAMHRLDLVEADALDWARPWPEPKEAKKSRTQRRWAAMEMERVMRKRADELVDHHEGIVPQPKVEKKKRSFASFIATTKWSWNRFSHVLTVAEADAPKSKEGLLRKAVGNALIRARFQARKSQITTCEVGPPEQQGRSDRLIPEMETPEWLVEMYKQQQRAKLDAQMDADAQGEANSDVNIEHKSDTVQLDAVAASTSSHVPTETRDQMEFCGVSKITPSKDLSERAFCFKTFQWSTGDALGKELYDTTLPADIIVAHPDQPNFALFNQHRYWTGDMEIELRLNANARLMGQVVMSWWYGYDYDLNREQRNNVYSALQTMHCLVTANTGNVGKITIPYRHVKPYLDLRRTKTSTGSFVAHGCKLGHLKIHVLVPLMGVAASAQAASISLFVSFKNSSFMGTVARSVVIPNMFTALMAAELMKRLATDNNRDQPAIPAMPSHVKPVTASNFAAGTNQARITNPIRLDPTAVLPYSGGRAPDVDEMQVNFLAGVFGFIKQVVWNGGDVAGTRVTSFEAAPILDRSFYPTTTCGGTSCFVVPPITFLSSMFNFWRGDLELRIDVIGATEINGRLMIAFVPSVDIPSYEQCMGSNPAYIDVQENRSFTFSIPFVSDKPWRPRRYRIGNSLHYSTIMGRVAIYVVNQLIPNPTVPDKVYLNLYLRGAPSFEVSVPAQSIVALAWDTRIAAANDPQKFSFKTSYWPVFVGSWRYADASKSTILRYGNTTDHVAQLSDVTKDYVLKRWAAKKGVLFEIIGFSDTDKAIKAGGQLNYKEKWEGANYDRLIKYVVPWTNDSNYMYALPFADQKRAQDCAKAILVYGPNDPKLWATVGLYVSDSQTFKGSAKGSGDLQLSAQLIDSVVIGVEGQMDERFNAPNVLSTEPLVPGTSFGGRTFGESFSDLKDVIRRTEPYMERTVVSIAPGNVASIRVPIMPQGLRLNVGADANPNLVSNYMRETNRALIASGYRFFAGSMSVKVKCTSYNHKTTFFVQHRVYCDGIKDSVVSVAEGTDGAYVGAENIYMNGFGTHVQDERNTCIIEVDVPFYLAGTCGFLQRADYSVIDNFCPDLRNFTSLGHLAIGVVPGSEMDGYKRVFSAWASGADDMRFFTFQGFPPVMFLDDPVIIVAPYNLIPKVSATKPRRRVVKQDKRLPRSNSSYSVVSSASEDLEPQMLPFVGEVGKFFGRVNRTAERMDHFSAQLEDINVTAVVQETLTDVKDTSVSMSYFACLYTAITNIVHCIINPAWKTISWAFASMFQFIFDVKDKVVTKICDMFQRILKCIPCLKKKDDVETPEVPETLEAQMDDPFEEAEQKSFFREHCSGIVSIVIAAIMTYLGFNAWRGEYDNRFVDLLFRLVKSFTSTANGLLTFFRATMDLILSMFDWCVARVFPQWDAVNFLAKNDVDLYKWAKTTQVLVDPRNRNEVLTNPHKIAELYATANEACLIQQRIIKLSKEYTAPQLGILNRLIDGVMRLRDQAAGLHIAPPVKFEPFVLQLWGPSNVGKSFLMSDLSIDMLDHINYRTFSEPTYTRAPGNDYWNGLTNQPIVLYDDFLALTSPEFSTTQLAELFQLKTRCVFNPPMAAVEDKTIRYNPLIVGICSNKGFYSLSGVLCPDAIHRRRDLLVYVELAPEYKSIHEIHDPEVLREYRHLRFSIHRNPKDQVAGTYPAMDFAQFKNVLLTTFSKYYAVETARYKQVSAKLFRLAPKLGEEPFKFANHEVGESLEQFYERRANESPIEDSMLKLLVAKVSGLPSYKRRTFNKLMAAEIQVIDEKRVDKKKAGDKAQGSEDHVINAYLRSYCSTVNKELDTVRAELQREMTLLRAHFASDEDRLSLYTMFEPQGPDGGKKKKVKKVSGGNSPRPNDEKVEPDNPLKIKPADAPEEVGEQPSTSGEQPGVDEEITSRNTLVDETVKAFFDENFPEWPSSVENSDGESAVDEAEISRKLKHARDEGQAMARLVASQKCMLQTVGAEEAKADYLTKKDPAKRKLRYARTVAEQQESAQNAEVFYDATETLRKEYPPILVPTLEARSDFNCVHEAALSCRPSSSLILYTKSTNAWSIVSSELMIPRTTLSYLCNKWGPLQDLPLSLSFEGVDWIQFEHKPCRAPKCPFNDKFKRAYYVQRYIECDTGLSFKQLNEDPDLKHHLPDDYQEMAPKDPVESVGWIQWIKDLKDKMLSASWGTIFKVIGYISAAIGVLIGIVRWFGPSEKKEEETVEEPLDPLEAESPWGEGPKNPPRKQNTKSRGMKGNKGRNMTRVHGGKFQGHAEFDTVVNSSVDSATANVVRRNTVYVLCHNPDDQEKRIAARCLGVVGRVAIFPSHYYDAWRICANNPGVKFFVHDVTMEKALEISWESLEIFVDECGSLGYIKFPAVTRQFRDIRSVLPKEDYSVTNRVPATLYELQHEARGQYVMCKTQLTATYTTGIHVDESGLFDSFTVPSGFRYGYGGAGVCGSVLADRNGTIIGMHVAGGADRTVGIAAELTSEDVEQVTDLLDIQGEMELDSDLIVGTDTDNMDMKSGTLSVIGLVDPEWRNFGPDKTAIRRSPLSDAITKEGITTDREPAVLSVFDPRIEDDKFSPLYEGIKHHGDPMTPFQNCDIVEVVEDLRHVILSNCEPILDAEITTLEIAVCGNPGTDYYDSLNMSSSAGWPWRLDERKNGHMKSGWVDVNYPKPGEPNQAITLNSIDRDLLSVMEEKHKARMAGVVPLTVFADILKDEVLKKEKATRKGGTRIISMSPIDFSIQQRQYTLAFSSSYMKHRMDLEHAVGINPDSDEWTDLFQRLVRPNRKHFVCADYSKFGDKLPSELGKACYRIIADWYQKNGCTRASEVRQVLTVMAEEVFSAKHIAGRLLYQTFAGMPSGNTLTVILNSMVNSMLIRLAYLHIMRFTPYGGLDGFKAFVTLYSYGDDLIMSVDERIVDRFNTETMCKFFGSHNLKFTDADKEGMIVPFRTVDNLCFLQRTWIPMPKGIKGLEQLMLAPLDRAAVENIPHWVVKRNCNADGALLQILECTRMAFTRGPKYYNNTSAKLRKVASEYGLTVSIPSWVDLCFRTYANRIPLMSFGAKSLLCPVLEELWRL